VSHALISDEALHCLEPDRDMEAIRIQLGGARLPAARPPEPSFLSVASRRQRAADPGVSTVPRYCRYRATSQQSSAHPSPAAQPASTSVG
jgi:hypothetical protein